VSPPRTTFQQLAIADEFLYTRQYDQALYAYRRLVDLSIPWLRLGALYACPGDERNAHNA